jgi:hypothetical protein
VPKVVISAMRPPSRVDEGSPLGLEAGDQVEGDVDAAGLGGDGLDVRVHRPLVGGVEDGHLGRTAGDRPNSSVPPMRHA